MKDKYIDITAKDGVVTYSKAKDGECIFRINGDHVTNFKVKEFACHDGSDLIKIDSDLVISLQNLREDLHTPITINSGYRTPEYNKKVGGAPRSQHIYGKAADIVAKDVKPLDVAIYAENDGSFIMGIGLYTTFTHVDTRKNKYYWDNRSGKEIPVDTFQPQIKPPLAVPILRAGMRGLQVQNLQKDLQFIGYVINPDGIFGHQTLHCLKSFQELHKIAVDGVYGNITRAELKKEMDKR